MVLSFLKWMKCVVRFEDAVYNRTLLKHAPLSLPLDFIQASVFLEDRQLGSSAAQNQCEACPKCMTILVFYLSKQINQKDILEIK